MYRFDENIHLINPNKNYSNFKFKYTYLIRLKQKPITADFKIRYNKNKVCTEHFY